MTQCNMAATARVAISGFATLDYIATTPRRITGAGTMPATTLTGEAWPRPGGAPLYAGKRLALQGITVSPIVTVGSRDGEAYLKACTRSGLDRQAIVVDPMARTPSCFLIYHQEDGSYTCLLDEGKTGDAGFGEVQKAVVASADLVIIAAGPSRISEQIVAQTTPRQKLAWIAKDDTACFPPDLCDVLSRRADVIFCNAAERHMIAGESTNPDRALVETRGAEGVLIEHKGRKTLLPGGHAVSARDTTGAGDTLAGEVLARWLTSASLVNIEQYVTYGMAAARDLLLTRSMNGHAACKNR